MRPEPYFHNYEYRHLLRSSSYMGEWKGCRNYPYVTFERLYKNLKRELKRKKLSPSGFSFRHTLTIADVFKFNANQTIDLIRAYHPETREKR